MRVFFCTLLFLLLVGQARSEVVEYEFDIDYKFVNFTGQTVKAITVGGGIPAPTLTATVGDILQVTFHNKMDVETSVHWHGLLLPNDQDGVPYLTTVPIRAGKSFTFRFPIKHHGTYWYHSHTNLQEQRGVYGALVFYPKKEIIQSDKNFVVVLSDWTNEKPSKVLANLKKDGDYYALKKDRVQSWDKIISNGMQSIKNRLNADWTRMGPMDISDVGYDAFLVNGKQQVQFDNVKPGATIRLRIINAAASSYFNVEFSGGPMTIVSADGVDTVPLKVKRLRMAIAETYDVLVTLPEHKAYELRATSEDGTGFTTVLLGQGDVVSAPDIPQPNLFLMGHGNHKMMNGMNGGMKHHQHHKMQMSEPKVEAHLTQYQNLRSPRPTTLDSSNPMHEVKLNLTGSMDRYVWSFNNKTLTESDKILIKKGENVRFVLTNETMMHHPLHLHGHFFRVLNGQGAYSPLKHTVNVPPMDTITIEFYANEEKDWFFHCHNLYHMKAGMAWVVRYEGNQTDPLLMAMKKSDPGRYDDAWFFRGEIIAYSNKADLFLRPSNIRNAFELKVEHDYEDAYDVEALYERSFTRFFSAYVGVEAEQEEGDSEEAATFGLRYVLPMLIEADVRVDSDGDVLFGLSRELQLTKRTHFEWGWDTDDAYEFFLNYEVNKSVLITANHSEKFDGGVGVKIKF